MRRSGRCASWPRAATWRTSWPIRAPLRRLQRTSSASKTFSPSRSGTSGSKPGSATGRTWRSNGTRSPGTCSRPRSSRWTPTAGAIPSSAAPCTVGSSIRDKAQTRSRGAGRTGVRCPHRPGRRLFDARLVRRSARVHLHRLLRRASRRAAVPRTRPRRTLRARRLLLQRSVRHVRRARRRIGVAAGAGTGHGALRCVPPRLRPAGALPRRLARTTAGAVCRAAGRGPAPPPEGSHDGGHARLPRGTPRAPRRPLRRLHVQALQQRPSRRLRGIRGSHPRLPRRCSIGRTGTGWLSTGWHGASRHRSPGRGRTQCVRCGTRTAHTRTGSPPRHSSVNRLPTHRQAPGATSRSRWKFRWRETSTAQAPGATLRSRWKFRWRETSTAQAPGTRHLPEG